MAGISILCARLVIAFDHYREYPRILQSLQLFADNMPSAAFPSQVVKHYELRETIGSGELE